MKNLMPCGLILFAAGVQLYALPCMGNMPSLPMGRTPFLPGTSARKPAETTYSGSWLCGDKEVSVRTENGGACAQILVKPPAGVKSKVKGRYLSVEFRIGGISAVPRPNVADFVKLALSPGEKDGTLILDAVFDAAKLASLTPTGKKAHFDCRVSMPRGSPDLVWNAQAGECVAYPEDPACRMSFAFDAVVRKAAHVGDIVPRGEGKICQHLVWTVPAGEGTVSERIMIDCGPSTMLARKTEPCYGAVDFDRRDAIHVPIRPTRNLLVNGGFEQGLKGWHMQSPCNVSFAGYADALRNGGTCYEEIVRDAKFGAQAVHFRTLLPGSVPDEFTCAPVSLVPNRPYTVSFWAKKDAGTNGWLKARIVTPVRKATVTGLRGTPNPTFGDLRLGTDWRRFEKAFLSSNGVAEVVFTGQGVTLDGVMIEEGEHATDTVDDPVVAHLLTSNPRNDLVLGAPMEARLALSAEHPAEGNVRVRVFNFYFEVAHDRTYAFRTPCEPIPLDFDQVRIGSGVFSVRYDFSAGGLSWTDYERFAVTPPLKNEHPTAFFFLHYPFFQTHGSTGPLLADWMAARGMGSTSWPRNDDRRKSPLKDLYDTGRFRSGVHTLEHDLKFRYPKRFAYGTHGFANLTTNVTEDVLEFIEMEAYTSGSICEKDDCRWSLSNEEESGLPLLRKDANFSDYFKCQYACWKGLKRAFDERGLKLLYAPTHGMCNYNKASPEAVGRPSDRRWAFDQMLAEAQKNGFRYDFISMHMYNAIDGSVLSSDKRVVSGQDRNDNAVHLFSRLGHYGYGADIPVRFEEGFNILPFYIPEWGASGWGDKYYSTYPSQAYGNTEFIQAAAIARIYLMDFKWWPRLETAHVWQHRPVMDFNLTPWMWTKVSNTLGHLLPDPRYVADARPFEGVRAYVYRQKTASGSYGVLAMWTCDNDVELGEKEGPTVKLPLPDDVRLIDLMGNERRRPDDCIPLTPAPLFMVSGDVSAMASAIGK